VSVPGAPLPVTASLEEARRRVAAGEHVVLVVDPGDSAGVAAQLAPGPGRASLMVGDVSDPLVRQAAEEMAAELGARTGPV
jgi:NAD(P)-dependent dehydrogenase (short-subunit alcohol dehydrogenase family)